MPERDRRSVDLRLDPARALVCAGAEKQRGSMVRIRLLRRDLDHGTNDTHVSGFAGQIARRARTEEAERSRDARREDRLRGPEDDGEEGEQHPGAVARGSTTNAQNRSARPSTRRALRFAGTMRTGEQDQGGDPVRAPILHIGGALVKSLG